MKYERKLGKIEAGFAAYKNTENGIQMASITTAYFKLQVNDVCYDKTVMLLKAGITNLLNHYEILNLVIHHDEQNQSYYFHKPKIVQPEFIKQVFYYDHIDNESLLQQKINDFSKQQIIDFSQSLFKFDCVFLKSKTQAIGQWHIFFTMHHSICDRLIRFTLIDKLMGFINQNISSNQQELFKISANIDSDYIIKLPQSVEHQLLIRRPFLLKLKMIKRLFANLFFGKPLIALNNHQDDIAYSDRHTRFEFITFNQNQTNNIVAQCKHDKISAQAFLSAAILIATAKEDQSNVNKFTLAHAIDLRKNNTQEFPQDPDKSFVCSATGVMTRLRLNKNKLDIISTANKIEKQLNKELNHYQSHLGIMMLMPDYYDVFSGVNQKPYGRYSTIGLSNLGRFKQEKSNQIKIDELHIIGSNQVFGPLISVVSNIVNNKLCLTTIATSKIVSKTQLFNINKNIKKTMIDYTC